MKKILTLTIIVVLLGLNVHSQGFFKRTFKISSSMQTYETQQEPAQFQLRINNHAKDDWLINAAVSAVFRELSSGPYTSKLVAELHRNTIIDEEQYNYQAGYQFVFMNGSGATLTPYIIGNLKYVRDRVEDNHSFVATVNLLGYLHTSSLSLGRQKHFDNDKFTYTISPAVEFQYQNFFASEADPGSIFRPMVIVSASLAKNWANIPGKISPAKMVEVSFNSTFRSAVINSTTNSEKYTKLFKAGINYFLYFDAQKESSPVSIGASYNLGSDPLNGLKDQKFWQLALQIKI
jgi:hypothetical protein